jgi:predicted ATPase
MIAAGVSMSSKSPLVGVVPRAAGDGIGTAVGRWHVRLLGAFHAQGQSLSHQRLPSRACTALLARLALQPGREHAREELIELLWPGVDLSVGRNRLRQTLSTLKALLEPPGQPPVILADRRTLRVVPGALSSDAEQFERLLRGGQLAEAAALYQGELLPGLFDEWIHDERNRLATLAERLPTLPAQPAVPMPPAAGTPASAHELPMSASRTTATGDPPRSGGAGQASLAAAQALSRHALPAYLTRFFGVDAQAARLRGQVSSHRLVTVIGPGGMGKTRLAVELAQAVRGLPDLAADPTTAPRFDHVAFVALAAARSVDQMLDQLAHAFGLQAPGHEVIDRLAHLLAEHPTLLVLDNLEQLLPDAAEPLGRLLSAAPRLHVLATSRRVLGIDGEREFQLPPLSMPVPGTALDLADTAAHAAVALFVDRARAARADFHLGHRNVEAVASLVSVLGGLPLAIELAAARVRSIGVHDMLLRLQPRADDAPGPSGLELLARAAPRAGHDSRHASMSQVIEWSWNLLPQPVRSTLAVLTVFVAGFTADAAAAVVGRDTDLPLQLDEAVRHSLLICEQQADQGLRFRLAEPVREFIVERVPPAARAAHQRLHRAWWPVWARTLGPTPPLAAVRAELPNLVAALSHANADGAPDDAIRTVLALRAAFKEVVLPGSGVAHLRQALASSGNTELRSDGLSLLAMVEYEAGERGLAEAHVQQALALSAPGSTARAQALQVAIFVRWTSTRNVALVEPLLDEAQALAEQLDEKSVLATVLANRAYVQHVTRQDYTGARQLIERSLQVWQAAGNRHGWNNGRYHLANMAYKQRRFDEALQGFAQVCDLAREADDGSQLSMAANALGNSQVQRRQWALALPSFREAAEVAWACHDLYNWIYAVWNLPSALVRCGQPEEALRLMAFAERYWTDRFGALSPADLRQLQRIDRLGRRLLGRAKVATLTQEGRWLEPSQAMQRLRRST